MTATPEPAAAAVDNSTFLDAVFGPDAPIAHITSFKQPPDAIPPEDRGKCWKGRHFAALLPDTAANNYCTISTFEPLYDEATRRYRQVRRKAQFRAGHCVVIDDIGTKVEPSRVRLPLSWELATSSRSRQGGYILDVPCTDQMLFSGLLAALVARGLSIDGKDPGMKGVTRYVRLPEGRNNKTSYGPAAFVCRMLDWHPERRYTMAQVLAAYGITEAEARALGEGVGGEGRDTSPKDDPLLAALTAAGLYRRKGTKIGWHDVTCPWVAEHSGGEDSGTGVFVGAEAGRYGFACHHGHCEHRTIGDLHGWLAEQAAPVTPFSVVDGGSVVPPPSLPSLPLETFDAPLDDSDFHPVPHLIDQVLPESSLILLWGDSGSYKSFLALDWALHVRYGMDWHGHTVQQGKVLYLLGEGRAGFPKRVIAWRRFHGIGEPAGTAGAFSVNRAADVVPFDAKAPPKVHLSQPYSLVVIDTLNRWSAGDENAADQMGEWLRRVQHLAKACGDAAVLIVHHAKKDGVLYRGSTAIKAAVDAEFQTVVETRPVLMLKHWKSKDDAMLDDLSLTLESVPLGAKADRHGHVREHTSLVVRRATGEEQTRAKEESELLVLRAVQDLHIAGEKATKNAICGRVKGRRVILLQRIEALERSGKLLKTAAGGYVLAAGNGFIDRMDDALRIFE